MSGQQPGSDPGAVRPVRVGPAAESAPQAFVEDLDHPELSPPDRHHLERSLRVRAGDEVVVADGRGRWRLARFGATVEPVGPVSVQPVVAPTLTVGFALVKGSRPELIVAKLTELGVDRIVALGAARSVVRWDGDRAEGHRQRLARVAREAAMQSRRAWLPEVVLAASLGELLRDTGTDAVALAEPGGVAPSLAWPTVLVGPEGGWTDEELQLTPTKVALGPQILRVETAAITVGVLLSALRAGLVGTV